MRVRPEAAWSVAGVVAAIGGYTGKVVYEQRQHYRHLQDKDNKWKLKFGPGSADELLQDSLKTGDILLFSRKWYHYHLPEAIYIKAYQTLFDTEYDHAGVCVCDKYGEPSILESTFWGGYKLRPFSERIAYSRAYQISLVMLNPRDAPELEKDAPHIMGKPRPPRTKIASSEARNEQLRKNAQKATQPQSPSSSFGPSGLQSGAVSTLVSAIMPFASAPKACHNVQLVQAVYSGTGLHLNRTEWQTKHKQGEILTCRNLLRPTSTRDGLSLVDTDYPEGGCEELGQRHFSKDLVLVRTQ